MEAHADDVLPVVLRHLDHLGVDLHHIGGLLGRTTLLQVEPQRREQLGRGELAQVIDIAGVVGRLHADEHHLGQALEISRGHAAR